MPDREKLSILVADDEPSVRGAVVAMLEWHGYRVLGAGDGRAALEAFRSGGERIELLVTDVDMPGMSGIDLSRRVLNDFPDVRVLLITGKPPLAGGEGLPILMKPFTPAELSSVVQSVLAAPPPRLHG